MVGADRQIAGVSGSGRRTPGGAGCVLPISKPLFGRCSSDDRKLLIGAIEAGWTDARSG